MVAREEHRPDIDGLRAVAVLSVLAFHLSRSYLPGGFVGVDIFFVISGYLITGIIAKQLDQGSFTVLGFYQRRIARIYPVLVTVAVATIAGASLFYLGRDVSSAGSSLMASVLSFENIWAMLLGNYFSSSSDAQPYLHYWSLSVEEQFYIAYPLFLIVLHRMKWSVPRTLAVLCGTSFLLYLALSRVNPTMAFFLPVTRAWQLLAGSILAVLKLRSPNRDGNGRVALLGIGILILSFVFITESRRFPMNFGLLPVIGTLCILGNESDGMANRFLSWKPLTAVGLISYSLYLWHWPVFSFVDYKLYTSPNETRLGLKLAIVLVFSLASYFLVEKPARDYLNGKEKAKVAFGLLFATAIPCAILGFSIHDLNYINSNLHRASSGGIAFGGSRGSIVLMGDSNGSMYGTTIRDIAKADGLSLNVLSVAGSDPLPFEGAKQNKYWNDSLTFVQRKHPDYVILACYWNNYYPKNPSRIRIAVDELARSAKHLILLTRPPHLPKDASREEIRNGARPPFMEDSVERPSRLAANSFLLGLKQGNVSVIDVAAEFDKGGAISFADDHGNQLFYDSRHISEHGGDLVKAEIASAISVNPR